VKRKQDLKTQKDKKVGFTEEEKEVANVEVDEGKDQRAMPKQAPKKRGQFLGKRK